MPDESARHRDGWDFLLGFAAGGALVGVPVGIMVSPGPWTFAAFVVAAGILGGMYGDRFLLWVADSTWWAAVRGFFRHWWL